jgi:hypothetical protein
MKEKNENGGASPTLQFIVSLVGAILVLRSPRSFLRSKSGGRVDHRTLHSSSSPYLWQS